MNSAFRMQDCVPQRGDEESEEFLLQWKKLLQRIPLKPICLLDMACAVFM